MANNSTPITLTDASTIILDYSLGDNVNVAITDNRNLSIINIPADSYGMLTVNQVGGSFKINFGVNDIFPSNRIGYSNIYTFYYDGSKFLWVRN